MAGNDKDTRKKQSENDGGAFIEGGMQDRTAPDTASFDAQFFDLSLDMCCVAGLDGYFKRINAAFKSTLGYTKAELLDKPFIDFVHPDDVDATLAEMGKLNEGVLTLYFENRYLCSNGAYKWLAWKSYPALSEGLIYATARDMTLVKNAEEAIRTQNERLEAAVELRTTELTNTVAKLEKALEQVSSAEADTRRQMRRLESLRKIDQAIASSTDIRVVMDVFLDQVTSRLRTDAAAVFVMRSGADTLQHLADRGFRTDVIRKTADSANKGLTAKCSRERSVVHVKNLGDCSDFARPELVDAEDAVFYCAAPLFVKGKVRGVLEVYNRTPLTVDDDWFRFLEMLAGQGAIGIENIGLFNSLERSHTELLESYDATLEGWVKALDLRDDETEGHTQRVTKLTVELARRLLIDEEDLQNIRRGALLHDIGKIGIPDSILLKPGKLTAEEMETMKLHPVYAHDWLSQIPYLRPALDIPYAHHEKFDGTGYPRGLAGFSIPLAARIFAVVDVWDALSHDRVYRAAWPVEKVKQHIAESAGTHFDPHIVQAFLQMLDDEPGLADLRSAA